MLWIILQRALEPSLCSSQSLYWSYLRGLTSLHSIPVEVNGHHVKAFVDSGAQSTISESSM